MELRTLGKIWLASAISLTACAGQTSEKASGGSGGAASGTSSFGGTSSSIGSGGASTVHVGGALATNTGGYATSGTGGTVPTTSAVTTGGAAGATSSIAQGGTGQGGAAQGGAAIGGKATGGTATGGAATGGGAQGGAATGGAAGASSTGGTGGCIDVCALYGARCCFGSGSSCVNPGGSCVFDVLSADLGTAVPYQYADLVQKVSSLPQDVVASFTDADIAWVAMDPPASARIEMHMTSEASSQFGAALALAKGFNHSFRVSCGGQSLFLGVLYILEGQAAIDTPVLSRSLDADNLMVLRLGAWEGAWYTYTIGGNLEFRQRIDRPELRAAFCQGGVLRDATPTSP